ncbi:glutamate-5-semialdehyde dehydrogenase [Candidatus Peregrinibacteria bacterium]|nr:glutamate-5-semialdehyde dehydrogenase [Candidatus Peregrinibacteria bacterium]
MDLTNILKLVQVASSKLVMLEDSFVSEILRNLAGRLEAEVAAILEANAKDLAEIDKSDNLYDRIFLDEARVRDIALSVKEIAGYDSPIGIELEHKLLDNGLDLRKVSVPLGVVGAIFEARPNVIIDIFALCLKSKNACVLKGGSQCEKTNEVLFGIIEEALGELKDACALLPNNHAIVNEFLKADKYVDVIVPRGSQELIDHVRANSLIPVIETGRGVCHTFVDESAGLQMVKDIIFNAKTQRPSVCNSLDTLIIHSARVTDLVALCRPLVEMHVEIFADDRAYFALDGGYAANLLHKANEENFGHEYLSLKMSIKTVDSFDEAIEHVNRYGSKHSEAIVTENMENGKAFMKAVDAACVYVNASTRFTDGGVFGLGAEVGISTQKLHARGPMGIKELTSYKWQIVGSGQVR